MDFRHTPGPGPRPPAHGRGRTACLSALLAAAVGLSGLAAVPASAANNPGTGDSGFFTFRPSEGVAGTQINVASGNALIRTRDLVDGPLTYHVVVDRAYNSLSPDTFTILSPRWGFDVGPDTKLTVESNQDATVRGPSGYRIRFERQTDGSYVAPEGFDGALVKTPSGWTLTRTSQNDEFGFDGSGNLTTTKDSSARDFTVQGTSAAGRTVLSSYGTASGRRVNLSYTGDSLVRLMDDPASGHHSYRYTAGRLTEYESPLSQITSYGYDSNGFLDEIVEPGGTTVELDVLSSGKINSITTTLPGGVPQATGFVYTRRTYKSDVTAPSGVRRTYAYDDDWRVTRQYNPDVVPAVSAAGELRDLAGSYVGPNRPYTIGVSADQPDGAGLRRISVERDSGAEVVGRDVPCTSTSFDLICPTSFAANLEVSFVDFTEGVHALRVAAVDDEEHHVGSESWGYIVDKTPPPGVDGVVIDDYDTDTSEVTVGINPADAPDPLIAPGIPGSGLAAVQFRWRKPGETWASWQNLPAFEVNVGVMTLGQQLEFETRSVDYVGNASTVRHDSLTVVEPPASTVEDSADPEWPEEETEVGSGTERVTVPVEIEGEPAEPHWIVKLDLGNGNSAYAATNEQGVATFTDVAPDSYSVAGVMLAPNTPAIAPEASTTEYSAVPVPRSAVYISVALQAAVDKICDTFTASAITAYCRLNDAEKAYLKQHVRLGLRFLVDGNDAARTTFRIFNQPGSAVLDGTRANAFQHAYWVALMTKRTYSRVYDFNLSEKGHGGLDWGEAHESEDINDSDSYIRRVSRMDLHNNEIGAQFANSSEERRKNNGRLCTGMRRAVFSGKLGENGARANQLYWIFARRSYDNGAVVPNPSGTC